MIERLHSDYKLSNDLNDSKISQVSNVEHPNKSIRETSFCNSAINKYSNNSPANTGISFNNFFDPKSKLVCLFFILKN